MSWVLKLAAESPTCVHMAGIHPCLTSCSSTTQKTGGGKGEGEFPHHQCSWCLAARVLASLGCAGGASMLDQAIAQGGEGLWVSQGTSHSAGETKLLQPRLHLALLCFSDAPPSPKQVGQTRPGATCFTFIYFCL